jgi:hypothetical protein
MMEIYMPLGHHPNWQLGPLLDNLSDELIACKKLAESWDCASLRGFKVLLIINIVK